MWTKARLFPILGAVLLLPLAFTLQGCMNPFPSIMKDPPNNSSGPNIPVPTIPVGGGQSSGAGDTGDGSGQQGGGSQQGGMGVPQPLPPMLPGGIIPGIPRDPLGGILPGGGNQPDSGGGSDGGNSDGGWETSNQLPDPLELPGMPAPSLPGEGDGAGRGDGDAQCDNPMETVLGDLDGDIMDRRNEAKDRGNSDGSNQEIPGAEDGGIEPGRDGNVPGSQLPDADQEAAAGPTPAPSAGPMSNPDKAKPDAKDDDIIARQLREAAEAEEDPELKQKLWEEYNRYKSRR